MEYYCTECKEPCAIYWGGDYYVSDCCDREVTTETPEEQRMNEAEYKQER